MTTGSARGLAQDLTDIATAAAEAIHRTAVQVGRAFEQAAKAIPPELIEGIARLPEAMRGKMAVQRRLLKHGIIPSDIVFEWTDPGIWSPDGVAERYAAKFDELGRADFAEEMRRFAKTSAVGNHDHVVRAVFPAVERIARQHVYVAGTGFNITSLPSVRVAVGYLLTQGTLGESSHALALDRFIFTLLDAIDFAYCDDSKAQQVEWAERHKRIFRFVPNRHRVCHGLDASDDSRHAINALTILYSVMMFAVMTSETGGRVPGFYHDGNRLLGEYKDQRRKFNSTVAGTFAGHRVW